MDAKDIFEKAIELVGSGDYKNDCNDDECAYCAISTAKTELDEQHGTGASLMECILFPNGGLGSDRPLESARNILIKMKVGNEPMSKAEVLILLGSALKAVKVA